MKKRNWRGSIWYLVKLVLILEVLSLLIFLALIGAARVLADAVDVGTCENKSSAANPGNTIISATNSANLDGTITSVDLWFVTNAAGVKVGTFYNTSGSNFTCRDVVTIGAVAAGSKQTYSDLLLDIEAGDLIGLYWSSGTMEYGTPANGGRWLASGDQTGGSSSYGYGASADIAIAGAGVSLKTWTLTISGNQTKGTTSPCPDSYIYWDGDEVDICAYSLGNFTFDEWDGDEVEDSEEECTVVTMDADMEVEALFEAATPCPSPTPTAAPTTTPTPKAGCGLSSMTWDLYAGGGGVTVGWCYENITGYIWIVESYGGYAESIEDGQLIYEGNESSVFVALPDDMLEPVYITGFVQGFTGSCELGIGGEEVTELVELMQSQVVVWTILGIAIVLTFLSLRLGALCWFVTAWAWMGVVAVGNEHWVQLIGLFVALICLFMMWRTK